MTINYCVFVCFVNKIKSACLKLAFHLFVYFGLAKFEIMPKDFPCWMRKLSLIQWARSVLKLYHSLVSRPSSINFSVNLRQNGGHSLSKGLPFSEEIPRWSSKHKLEFLTGETWNRGEGMDFRRPINLQICTMLQVWICFTNIITSTKGFMIQKG